MFNRLLFTIVMSSLLSISLVGQQQDFNKTYIPIQSKGDLPVSLINEVDLDLDPHISHIIPNTEKPQESDIEYIKSSHHALMNILQGGDIVFGHEINQYLEEIKNNILADDEKLRNEISIIPMKSPIANAACTNLGTIFINVGLISHLENEAELAYIISHEIAHYVSKHGYERYLEVEEHNALSKKKKRKNYKTHVEKYYQHSKENEIEADSIGFLLFQKSGYQLEAVATAFDKLHQSHHPYINEPSNFDWLNTEKIEIPSQLHLEKIDPIVFEDEKNDRYRTHPNIDVRKSKLEKHFDANENTELFLVSAERFNSIKELCQFETIRLEQIKGEYGKAIFYATNLLEKYPENIFLKNTIAFSLYGLAKYKNKNKLYEVANSYKRSRGQSQAIHYLIKKLKIGSLNALAIEHLEERFLAQPNDSIYYHYINNLTRDLVLQQEKYWKDVFPRLAEKSPHVDSFHLYSLENNYDDSVFVEKIKKAETRLEDYWEYEKLTEREKNKLNKKSKKGAIISPPKKNIEKVLLVSPSVEVYGKEGIDYEKSKAEALQLKNKISKQLANLSIEQEWIGFDNTNTEDIEEWNDISLLKEWVDEKLYHFSYTFTPSTTLELMPFIDKKGTKYAIYSSIQKDVMGSSYVFFAFDLKDGYVYHLNYEQGNLTTAVLAQKYAEDLHYFLNH